MPKVFTGSYELHLAISEDIASGWIWVQTNSAELRKLLDAHRPVAKVSCAKASVYCEVLNADEYDLKRFNEIYNKHALSEVSSTPKERVFINHWYRNKLGIGALKAGSTLNISFKFNLNLMGESWYQANACMAHPQVIVRVAAWVGLVALGLGLFGAGLALLPLADEHGLLNAYATATHVIGAVLCGGGLFGILWCTFLFAKSRGPG
jgi:hypothetical protein